MKKVIYLAAIAIMFVACQQNYSRTGPAVDLVKDALTDYHNGDWDNWVSKFADTAKIHHNVPDGNGVSAAQQVEAFKPLLAPLSSYSFDEDIWFEQVVTDEGETWVNVWGDWHAVIAATNQEIVIPVHLTSQVEDGLVRKEFVYYDPAPLVEALEAIEAAAAAAAAEANESEDNDSDE